jgi:integrase
MAAGCTRIRRRAEREGFEPSDPVTQVNSLAVSPIRPLSHLSNWTVTGPVLLMYRYVPLRDTLSSAITVQRYKGAGIMAGRAAKGTGSVKPRPGYKGAWRLRWRDATGKERATSFRGGRAAAHEELNRRMGRSPEAVERPTEQNATAAAGGRTLADALEQYAINIAAQGKSPRTVNEVRRIAADARCVEVVGIKLAKLTPDALDREYETWTREGLAASTVRKYHATISAALSHAVSYGWLTDNPAKRCRAVPSVRLDPVDVPITHEDVAQLIAAAEGRDDVDLAAAMHLGLATGGRRGELAAIRWDDIDLRAGTMTITGNLIRDGGDWKRKSTKTGRVRTVVLPPRTVDALRNLRRLRPDDMHVLRIHPDKITDRFRKQCAALDIEARFHDLRHAAASYQLTAGIDPVTVCRNLGWTSVRMLDRYGHALEEGQRQAAEAMNELLPG